MFKYHFYYSERQKRVMASLGHDGKSFIVLSTGMEVEYTQMCSFPDSKCNWEDARLVYASDTKPEITHVWGEAEKEEWNELCKEYESAMEEAFGPAEMWDDLDEPDDTAAFEAYEREANEAWNEWMDNRPFPDIDNLTPDMDEDIPEEHLKELRKIEEPYLRGKDFNQDT